MNIITFSNELEARVKEHLATLDVHHDEITKVGNAVTLLRSAITELKSFLRTYHFKDENEEIIFFKEIKPVFLSQLLLHKKIFAMRLFNSFRDIKARHAYYQQALHHMEKFTKKNIEFCEYCMTGNTHLDRHYFTRTAFHQNAFDRDEQFTTGYDTKLAKILANELLKSHILAALQSTNQSDLPVITWTSSKTALIELIYALSATGSFDNGTADIKQIASKVESAFNVSLGNYYRTFQDIRMRKINRTVFLDELKEKFTARLDEMN